VQVRAFIRFREIRKVDIEMESRQCRTAVFFPSRSIKHGSPSNQNISPWLNTLAVGLWPGGTRRAFGKPGARTSMEKTLVPWE
jgi:hypothetical protein